MAWWVVAYDCGEAQIVQCETREEAARIYDDLGCAPVAAYGPDEVYLVGDTWNKNGQWRCNFERREKV